MRGAGRDALRRSSDLSRRCGSASRSQTWAVWPGVLGGRGRGPAGAVGTEGRARLPGVRMLTPS